jgi:hypothetical protein
MPNLYVSIEEVKSGTVTVNSHATIIKAETFEEAVEKFKAKCGGNIVEGEPSEKGFYYTVPQAERPKNKFNFYVYGHISREPAEIFE